MGTLNFLIVVVTLLLITMGSFALADSITIAKSIPLSEFSGATENVMKDARLGDLKDE